MHLRDKLSLVKQIPQLVRPREGLVEWLALSALRKERRIRISPKQHNLCIRTSSPDLRVAVSCFGGEFDELISAVPKIENPLIIDGGGYIGTAAIILAEAYPHATVVTVEPSKENFSLLQENVAPYKNIVPINKALAVTSESAILKNRGTGQWGFTTVSKPEDNLHSAVIEEVDCITIEMLMKQFNAPGLGIVKLDIEGGEYALFSGDTQWVQNTEAICIELHDRIIGGCTDKFMEATTGRRNYEMRGEKYLSLR